MKISKNMRSWVELVALIIMTVVVVLATQSRVANAQEPIFLIPTSSWTPSLAPAELAEPHLGGSANPYRRPCTCWNRCRRDCDIN